MSTKNPTTKKKKPKMKEYYVDLSSFYIFARTKKEAERIAYEKFINGDFETEIVGIGEM